MNDRLKGAADEIFAARNDLVQVDPVRERFSIATIEDAYAVQAHNTRRWLSAGRRKTGYKIGLTSKAVQSQLGVDQPDFGVLWADYEYADGSVVPASRFMQARAEAEVAFVVGRAIDDPEIPLTALIAAIEYALPAVEIVDTAIRNWDIRLVDTVADNASGGGYVLGMSPRKVTDVDLRLAGAMVSRNGEQASMGVGAACLGHPLFAALWLARKMALLGSPLAPGDLVLSGALGPMVDARAGDVFSAEIHGFAPVGFSVGAEK